jgi:hypothetical protein
MTADRYDTWGGRSPRQRRTHTNNQNRSAV